MIYLSNFQLFWRAMENINFLYILYKKHKFHFCKLEKLQKYEIYLIDPNKKKKNTLKNKSMILFSKIFL